MCIRDSVWPAGQNTELALGTAAMYLNGSWLPNEVKDMAGPDFHWGDVYKRQKQTFYYAVKLTDDQVLRVARTTDSLLVTMLTLSLIHI